MSSSTHIVPGAVYDGRIDLKFAKVVAVSEPECITQIINGITDEKDLSSYVQSVIRFPFNIFSYFDIAPTTYGSVKVAGKTITFTNTATERQFEPGSPLFLFTVADFYVRPNTTYPYFQFLNYKTEIELFLPYYGIVKLDPKKYMYKYVKVQYSVDIMTGDCTIYLSISNEMIDYVMTEAYQCNLGLAVPYSTSNLADIKNQQKFETISGAIAVGGGLVGLGVGLATGNVLGVAGGAGAIAGGATKIAQTQQTLHPSASNYSGSGFSNLRCPRNCILTIYYPEVVIPSNYGHIYGHPYRRYVPLSEMHGYIEMGEFHTDGSFSTAYDADIAEIKVLMQSGVILPNAGE